MKQCRKCGIEQPLSAFHADAKSTDGRAARCKSCRCATSRVWHAKNRDRGKARSQAWRLAHPEQANISKRAWKDRNRDQVREAQRAWYEANRGQANAATRRWQRVHAEQAKATQRARYARMIERERTRRRKRHQLHPEQSREYKLRRRARLRGNGLFLVDLRAIIQRDGLVCHICKRPIQQDQLSFDHLVPVAHGGAHAEWNLRPAHLTCNKRRGAGRLPAQLMLYGEPC